MLLGARTIAQSDQRLILVDYKEFLARGATIVSVAVTLPAGTISTVGAITLFPNKEKVQFFIIAGTTNETFTATVIMTDSTGQIVHDTLEIVVSNP